MKLNYSIISFATIAMLSFMACGSSAEKVQKAQDNLEKEKADYEQAKLDSIAEFDSFKMAYEAQIDANEKTVAALRSELKKDKKKYEEVNKKIVDDLEEKNSNMRKKIREFKRESKSDWLSFKEEFSYDMDELGKAIKGIGENNSK